MISERLKFPSTLSISATEAPRDIILRDFPIALLSPLLIGGLILDGRLSRPDGMLLLALFFAWMFAVAKEAHKQRNIAHERPEKPQYGTAFFF